MRRLAAAAAALLWALQAAAASLTDAEIGRIRDGVAERRAQVLAAQAERPFPKPECRAELTVEDPCILGQLNQALALFHRAGGAARANDLLRAAVAQARVRPGWEREFHGVKAGLFFRIVALFGAAGTRQRGLVAPEVERAVGGLFAEWSARSCRVADARNGDTWRVWGSENHGAQRDGACWAASVLDGGGHHADGSTAADQRAAWEAHLKAYMRARGREGVLIESFSPTYAQYTLANFHNYLDFAADPEMRRLARATLDLWWALWAQEQTGGVHGGAKSRAYPRIIADGTPLDGLPWLYFALGPRTPRVQGPGLAAMTTSDYQPPEVVADLALDVAGRGTYEVRTRAPGLARRPFADDWYEVDPDAGGTVRVAHVAPGFVMGTAMVARRPGKEWTAMAAQNRWSGVVLAGDPRARIVAAPEARGSRSNYNAILSVQSGAAQILQAPRAPVGVATGAMRIWFGKPLARVERDGWIFAEGRGAWVAVRPARGGYRWDRDEPSWMRPDEEDAPVVVQAAEKSQFADFRRFQEAVLALPLRITAERVEFRGLGKSGTLALPLTGAGPPAIDGRPVDLDPPWVLASPFVNQRRGEATVTVAKDARRLVIDFR
ncbi:MAG: hypothetical protein AB7P02_01895 [Alphaproteobacteria bacterium]